MGIEYTARAHSRAHGCNTCLLKQRGMFRKFYVRTISPPLDTEKAFLFRSQWQTFILSYVVASSNRWTKGFSKSGDRSSLPFPWIFPFMVKRFSKHWIVNTFHYINIIALDTLVTRRSLHTSAAQHHRTVCHIHPPTPALWADDAHLFSNFLERGQHSLPQNFLLAHVRQHCYMVVFTKSAIQRRKPNQIVTRKEFCV